MRSMVHEGNLRGMVDKAVCEELLQWLEKSSLQKPIYRRILHFLRAFVLYAEIGHPCILTYQQFRDYCENQKADSVQKLRPKTIQKECCHLSTRLLPVACHRLGWNNLNR